MFDLSIFFGIFTKELWHLSQVITWGMSVSNTVRLFLVLWTWFCGSNYYNIFHGLLTVSLVRWASVASGFLYLCLLTKVAFANLLILVCIWTVNRCPTFQLSINKIHKTRYSRKYLSLMLRPKQSLTCSFQVTYTL